MATRAKQSGRGQDDKLNLKGPGEAEVFAQKISRLAAVAIAPQFASAGPYSWLESSRSQMLR